jgi:uncharacterized membrane protein
MPTTAPAPANRTQTTFTSAGPATAISLYATWGRRFAARLAVFALSPGKIFLYDLPALSSIERALSYLDVGAVLLLGGFFDQRLNVSKRADADRRGGRTA